jgi:hypothetical protein
MIVTSARSSRKETFQVISVQSGLILTGKLFSAANITRKKVLKFFSIQTTSIPYNRTVSSSISSFIQYIQIMTTEVKGIHAEVMVSMAVCSDKLGEHIIPATA